MTKSLAIAITASIAAGAYAPPARAQPASVPAEQPSQAEAERSYRHEELTFNDLFMGTSTNGHLTSVSRGTLVYKGDRLIDQDEFYSTIERPDLAETFHHRRKIGMGMAIGAGIGLGLSLAVFLGPGTADLDDNCEYSDGGCLRQEFAMNQDREAAAQTWRHVGYGMGGISLVAALVSGYYLQTATPITERELHDLADEYNAKQRRRYGVARVRPRAHAHDVALTPVFDGKSGGLSLAARF